MILFKRIATVVFAGAFLFSTISFVGCAKPVTDDDLQKLRESSQAVTSAEKELKRLKKEQKTLEGELAKKTKELEKSQRELENVKSK